MEVIINPPKFILLPGRVTVTRRAHNAELMVQFHPQHPILFNCILFKKGFGLRGERGRIKQLNFVLLNLWACTGFDSVIDL